MKSRRKAREAALQALYQCDTTGDYSVGALHLFLKLFHPLITDFENDEEQIGGEPLPGAAASPLASESQHVDPLEYHQFCESLVQGVFRHMLEIDRQISVASTHWSINRMARVDRNILRIATYEIMYCAEIPLNVTINEAIEVAKRFGSDDSPMFVNGVLDHVAKILDKELRLGDKGRSHIRKTA